MVSFAQLPAGFRLLCLAAGWAGPDRDATIRRTMAAIGDWDQVLRAAESHHVTPLLATLADGPAGEGIPAETRRMLSVRRDRQVRRCLSQVAELVRLGGAMEAAGIRCLALKGVALSLRLYGDPARRGLGDIDLLVDPDRFDDARAVLAGRGYVACDVRIDAAGLDLSSSHVRDLALRHPQGHLVELHRRLTLDASLLPGDFHGLWERRRPLPGRSWPVFTLSAEDEALYLLVHGAEHGWTRLRWIADLIPLLEEPVLFEAVQRRARTLHLWPALADASELCNLLLAADLPVAVQGRRKDWSDVYCRWFVANDAWVGPPAPGEVTWHHPHCLRMRWYRYTLRRTWRGACSRLLADLSEPVDWHLFRLSPGWRWLYPMLRPVGWCLRRIKAGRAGRAPRD